MCCLNSGGEKKQQQMGEKIMGSAFSLAVLYVTFPQAAWAGFNLWTCLFSFGCVCVFKCVRFKVGGLLTGGVCVSVPLLASRLRMLLSDICRRAAMGGTRDSVAGSRVTSAFMSLSSSSNWFNTAMTTTNASTPTDWYEERPAASLLIHFFSHFRFYFLLLLHFLLITFFGHFVDECRTISLCFLLKVELRSWYIFRYFNKRK